MSVREEDSSIICVRISRLIISAILTPVIAGWVLLYAGIAAAEDGTPVPSDWHYGAYLDGSYPLNFNFPENHKWRSKSTTPRTNEFAPNMALGYVRKDVMPDSRWGMEVGIQGGYDTNLLVPSPTPQGGAASRRAARR